VSSLHRNTKALRVAQAKAEKRKRKDKRRRSEEGQWLNERQRR